MKFDVEEYIASGIIELCLMGAATPDEVAELDRLARLHPRIAQERDSIQRSLEGLHLNAGLSNKRTPPPGLKEKILAAAYEEVPPVPAPEENTPQARNESTTSAVAPKSQWLMAAATLIALAGFVFMTVQFFRTSHQLDEAQQAQAGLEKQVDSLMNQSRSLAESLQLAARERDSIWMACVQAVEMKGLPKSPVSRAFVYYDAKSGEVMAQVENLPVAPSGMDYQLWAIVKGVPVDLGVLPLQGEKMPPVAMKKVLQAEAFAVTLEKAGGSPTPNLDMMFVLGSV